MMKKILLCFALIFMFSCLAYAEKDYTEETFGYDKPAGMSTDEDEGERDVEVTGSDMDGDYVQGDVELDSSGEGEGRLFDEDDNEEDIDVDSDDDGDIEGHDEGGIPYGLDED